MSSVVLVGPEAGKPNEAHGTRRVLGQTLHLLRNDSPASAPELGGEKNQIGSNPASTSDDELWPGRVLEKLRSTPNAVIGTPLSLLLEQLSFVSKRSRWRGRARSLVRHGFGLGSAAVSGHQEDLPPSRFGQHRREADEAVACERQVRDSQYGRLGLGHAAGRNQSKGHANSEKPR